MLKIEIPNCFVYILVHLLLIISFSTVKLSSNLLAVEPNCLSFAAMILQALTARECLICFIKAVSPLLLFLSLFLATSPSPLYSAFFLCLMAAWLDNCYANNFCHSRPALFEKLLYILLCNYCPFSFFPSDGSSNSNLDFAGVCLSMVILPKKWKIPGWISCCFELAF